jgi:hypothetical protein
VPEVGIEPNFSDPPDGKFGTATIGPNIGLRRPTVPTVDGTAALQYDPLIPLALELGEVENWGSDITSDVRLSAAELEEVEAGLTKACPPRTDDITADLGLLNDMSVNRSSMLNGLVEGGRRGATTRYPRFRLPR